MIALLVWMGNIFVGREEKVSDETLARLNAVSDDNDFVPSTPWRMVRRERSARDAYRKPFQGE